MSSANNFREAFNLHEPVEQVVIDLTHSHLWDQSAVMAIDEVVLKLREHGSTVSVVGMNDAIFKKEPPLKDQRGRQVVMSAKS